MREEDLKTYWQQREMEQPQMTAEQVRIKATQFQRAMRRRDLIEYAACAIVVLAFGAYAWILPNILVKLGSFTMVLAALFVTYQLRKHGASRFAPSEGAVASLFEFHRNELVRRRDLLRHSWRLLVGPLMPGMLLYLGGMAQQPPEGKLHLVILGGIMIFMGVAISLHNRWSARRLQRDIDGLDTLASNAPPY